MACFKVCGLEVVRFVLQVPSVRPWGKRVRFVPENARKGIIACLAAPRRRLTKYLPVGTVPKRGWALLQVVVNANKDISVSYHVSKFEKIYSPLLY